MGMRRFSITPFFIRMRMEDHRIINLMDMMKEIDRPQI